ncbi:amidohydrolase family protein [Actinomyces gaoshouyii]|nr:amidohydrolase family protein [Actinomyces gaoshouyii]
MPTWTWRPLAWRASCAEEVLGIVAVRARALRAGAGAADGPALIQGFGHRLSNWPRVPSVAELDDIPGSRELVESGYRRVLEDMAARGITGVTDMTWGQDSRLDRMSATGPLPGLPRIRVSTCREGLEERIDAHLRTGSPLPGSPAGGDGAALPTQGPLKIISDGSMGTGTARLCRPYPADLGLDHPHGVMSVGLDELTRLLGRAHEHGMTAAAHAIGDAALIDVAAPVRAGSRADLVPLPDDPLMLGPEDLRAVRPLATVVAGALTAHR